MNNEAVIIAKNLCKTYKLYKSPFQVLLDKSGLGFLLREKPRVHHALNGVSLEIKRGEKVALIGRNGAGKSTFLKLVSGISEKTSGTLEIGGQVQALLSIGSGFHQEFTGRENVYAYLANQGIAGKEADRLFEEIVDFAEVEEYIDQPLRTYSTGMGVRLMFATSTVIAPEILILDEVLGVGDAYFSQKSYERLRNLAAGSGTTLLLVSHDIYSATSLCERVIWLDKGRVMVDGPAKEAVAVYENSVKIQEEERLRVKNRRQKKTKLEQPKGEISKAINIDENTEFILEIKPGNGKYFEAPFLLASVELYSEEKLFASWNAADAPHGENLIKEGCQWGNLEDINGCQAYQILDYGSPFQKAALHFSCTKSKKLINPTLRFNARSTRPVSFTFIYNDGRQILSTTVIQLSKTDWLQNSEKLEPSTVVSMTPNNWHGAADVILNNPRLIQNDKETILLEPCKPWSALIDYTIKNSNFIGNFEIIIGFQDSNMVNCRSYFLIEKAENLAKSGTICFGSPWLPLGRGEYTLNLAAVAEGYNENFCNQKFYSINRDIYCALNNALFFEVDKGPELAQGAASIITVNHDIFPR